MTRSNFQQVINWYSLLSNNIIIIIIIIIYYYSLYSKRTPWFGNWIHFYLKYRHLLMYTRQKKPYSIARQHMSVTRLLTVYIKLYHIFLRTRWQTESRIIFWHSEDRASWYILKIKTNEVHYFSIFLVQNSTCFGQVYCPSSAV